MQRDCLSILIATCLFAGADGHGHDVHERILGRAWRCVHHLHTRAAESAARALEVLLLPMSLFEAVQVMQGIINATEKERKKEEMQRAKLERSGFPDVVHLRQVEAV